MADAAVDLRLHAHELIERMTPWQVPAAVELLETMLDPLARSLANAPYDDEPVSEEEAGQIEAASASLARGEGVSHEDILAEYGLTLEDFERMGRTPLEADGTDQ
jgi:hypothetical protein